MFVDTSVIDANGPYMNHVPKKQNNWFFLFKNSAQVDIGLRCQILSAKTQGYTYA